MNVPGRTGTTEFIRTQSAHPGDRDPEFLFEPGRKPRPDEASSVGRVVVKCTSGVVVKESLLYKAGAAVIKEATTVKTLVWRSVLVGL